MDEVEALLRALLAGVRELGPAERLSYGEAFRRYAGVDPHRAPVAELIACAEAQRLPPVEGLGPEERDGWLDWLLTQRVEPRLGRAGPTFLHDYPASQAALARVRPGEPPLAERFELYLDGVELANGFHELGDAAEQRRRFVAENGRRAAAGMAELPYDRHLLAALESGLPPCAGVALGLDRLLLAATGARSLAEVIAFTVERA